MTEEHIPEKMKRLLQWKVQRAATQSSSSGKLAKHREAARLELRSPSVRKYEEYVHQLEEREKLSANKENGEKPPRSSTRKGARPLSAVSSSRMPIRAAHLANTPEPAMQSWKNLEKVTQTSTCHLNPSGMSSLKSFKRAGAGGPLQEAPPSGAEHPDTNGINSAKTDDTFHKLEDIASDRVKDDRSLEIQRENSISEVKGTTYEFTHEVTSSVEHNNSSNNHTNDTVEGEQDENSTAYCDEAETVDISALDMEQILSWERRKSESARDSVEASIPGEQVRQAMSRYYESTVCSDLEALREDDDSEGSETREIGLLEARGCVQERELCKPNSCNTTPLDSKDAGRSESVCDDQVLWKDIPPPIPVVPLATEARILEFSPEVDKLGVPIPSPISEDISVKMAARLLKQNRRSLEREEKIENSSKVHWTVALLVLIPVVVLLLMSVLSEKKNIGYSTSSTIVLKAKLTEIGSYSAMLVNPPPKLNVVADVDAESAAEVNPTREESEPQKLSSPYVPNSLLAATYAIQKEVMNDKKSFQMLGKVDTVSSDIPELDGSTSSSVLVRSVDGEKQLQRSLVSTTSVSNEDVASSLTVDCTPDIVGTRIEFTNFNVVQMQKSNRSPEIGLSTTPVLTDINIPTKVVQMQRFHKRPSDAGGLNFLQAAVGSSTSGTAVLNNGKPDDLQTGVLKERLQALLKYEVSKLSRDIENSPSFSKQKILEGPSKEFSDQNDWVIQGSAFSVISLLSIVILIVVAMSGSRKEVITCADARDQLGISFSRTHSMLVEEENRLIHGNESRRRTNQNPKTHSERSSNPFISHDESVAPRRSSRLKHV